MKLSTLSLLLLPSVPIVTAWGTLGHETVAYIASNFVTQEAEAFMQTILRDDSRDYMARVATWADIWRYTKPGHFSEVFHYIDAMDSPPEECGVTFDRDCGARGCIVGAVKNYTERVIDATLSPYERSVAAKMIIHFLGDIHQPLHIENLSRGMNGIPVTVYGQKTSLHGAWDRYLPEHLMGYHRDPLATAKTWADSLSNQITFGTYRSEAASWLNGLDITDPVSSALVWATQSNAFVCSHVIPNGADAVNGTALDGAYYEAAIPVIQLQIARAGFRLAAWLNALVSIKTEL